MRAIRGEEDTAEVGGDLGAQFRDGNSGRGILLEVALAARPGHGSETGMVVADAETEVPQSSLEDGGGESRFWDRWAMRDAFPATRTRRTEPNGL